jgi:dolichol-phosphate mannosyltransferase
MRVSEQFTLVVPTLNEAGNIGPLLSSLQDVMEEIPLRCGVTIVDDGSTDGTCDVVNAYGARDRRIRLLRRAGERGLAGAILDGWATSQAEFLGVMDGDLQHPPDLLPSLVSAAQGADVAIASRYARENGVDGWNPARALISKLTTLASLPLLRPLRVTDPMSGFFIVRRECTRGISFQRQGFKLLLDVLVRGRVCSVKEVPYSFGLRHAGKSKAGPSVALHYLQLLGRLSLDSLRGQGS